MKNLFDLVDSTAMGSKSSFEQNRSVGESCLRKQGAGLMRNRNKKCRWKEPPVWVALLCVFGFAVNGAQAGTIVIDQDTIIDATNSIGESGISLEIDELIIQEGSSGSPLVNIVEGGFIEKPTSIQEESHLQINGGRTGYFVDLRDQASLTLIEGSIACSASGCLAILPTDRFSLVRAFGESELHLHSNSIFNSAVRLFEQSSAHLYGKNLSIVSEVPELDGSRRLDIHGLFSANSVSSTMKVFLADNATIVLHRIPEPNSLLLLLLAWTGCAGLRKASL